MRDPAQIPMHIVSGNFFDVLGVGAAIGRTLTSAEDVPGSARAVTISHALWQQRFGADPSVVGQSLTLDGEPFTVTGVAPRGFAYPPDAQMWVTNRDAEFVPGCENRRRVDPLVAMRTE